MGGVLRVLLTLAMAGASIAYFAGEKRVTLADEGNVRRVTTFAPTVGGALKRQGIRVRADDRVSPSLTSALAGHIELRRAKDIVLVLNGQHGPARVTARTVRSVLDELSVRHEGAVVKPALGTAVGPGDQILVSQPVQVTVVHDGVSEQVTTNAVTAGDLLREMDIQLGPQDRVEPSTGAHPDPSAPVRLVRVKQVVTATYSKIPFTTVTVNSDELEHGVRKVSPGTTGLLAKTYRVTYEDGKVMSKMLEASRVVRQPQARKVVTGTRRPAFTPRGGTQTGRATWYQASGLVAAHRTLPVGTVVRVTNLANGHQVNVVIRGRGPFTAGTVIDLSPAAFNQLASLSQGVLNVKIEW